MFLCRYVVALVLPSVNEKLNQLKIVSMIISVNSKFVSAECIKFMSLS